MSEKVSGGRAGLMAEASPGFRRPVVQLQDIRTSKFGTVQQAPSASMNT
jgi:hypothetical protein